MRKKGDREAIWWTEEEVQDGDRVNGVEEVLVCSTKNLHEGVGKRSSDDAREVVREAHVRKECGTCGEYWL